METTKFLGDLLMKIKDTKFQNPMRIQKCKFMFFKENFCKSWAKAVMVCAPHKMYFSDENG